jgi:hypothetical protein
MNMIEIELPDGSILEVPEGTSQQDIMSAINQLQSQTSSVAPQSTPAPSTPAPSVPQEPAPPVQQFPDATLPPVTAVEEETAPTGRRRSRRNTSEANMGPEPGSEPGFSAPYDAAGLQAELNRGVRPSRLVDALIRQGATSLQVGEQDFDLIGAREAGVDDREILHILTTGRPWTNVGSGFWGHATALGMGSNTALSNLAGAPTELANLAIGGAEWLGRTGLRAAGFEVGPNVYPVDRPFGGVRSIQDGARAVGLNTYQDVNDLPPPYRPAAVSGEVIGPGLGIGAAVSRLAVRSAPATAQSSQFRQTVEPILSGIRNNPRTAALLEVSGVMGAAWGAAFAELFDPGSETTRMGAEFVGGLVSPVALLGQGISIAAPGVSRFVATYWPGDSGKEYAARQAILRVIQQTGEDPAQIIRFLDRYIDNPVVASNLTAGQASGSPTLLALERALGAKNQQFFGYQEETITAGFAALRQAADAIAADGSPAALQAAARMRRAYFQNILSERLRLAREEATLASSRFHNMSATEASEGVRRILNDSLEDVRTIERELWSEIPRDIPLSGDNTISALGTLRQSLLREESPPDLAQRFVQRIAGDNDDSLMATLSMEERDIARLLGVPEPSAGGTNVGEILIFRNRMLTHAREAKAAGQYDVARQFNIMADGALRDLDTLGLPEAETARAFSRELNQIFGHPAIDNVLAVTGRGTNVVDPDRTLDYLYSGGSRAANSRFGAADRATQFADESTATYRGDSASRLPEFRQETDEYLRRIVYDLRDGVTGEVSEARIRGFVRDNPELLERYPNLQSDLESYASASANVAGRERLNTQASTAVNRRAVFTDLLGNEDPSRVVEAVLTGARPQAEYTQMARLAQRAGDDAVRGLEAATMDYAVRSATGETGQFNFGRFITALTTPPNARGQSPIDMMVQNGVMSQDDAGRLLRILDEAERLMVIQSSTARIDGNVIDEPSSAIFDFAQRLVGAQASQLGLAGQMSGSSLVIAGAGSRTVRTLADRVPRARTIDALVAFSKDPVAMRDLLASTGSPEQAVVRNNRLHAYLLQQGVIDLSADEGYPSSIERDETERMLDEEDRSEGRRPRGQQMQGSLGGDGRSRRNSHGSGGVRPEPQEPAPYIEYPPRQNEYLPR